MPSLLASRFKEIYFLTSERWRDRDKHLRQLWSERLEVKELSSDPGHWGKIPTGSLFWISGWELAHLVLPAKHRGFKVILDQAPISPTSRPPRASLWNLRERFGAGRRNYLMERYCATADAHVAASESEALQIQDIVRGAQVFVIPAWLDCEQPIDDHTLKPQNIQLIPNLSRAGDESGLTWFFREVFPRLEATGLFQDHPLLIGLSRSPGPKLQHALDRSKVTPLDASTIEPHELLRRSAVSLAPVLGSSDYRTDILTSMLWRRAVVTTGPAARKLDLSPTHDVFLADSPDTFAADIVRLFANPDFRIQIATNAWKTIKDRFDWRAHRETLQGLIRILD